MTVAQLSATNPVVDWKEYLRAQGLESVTTLNVTQPAFQKEVDRVLTNEPLENLKAYLRFHVITAAAPSLSEPFEEAAFNFYSRHLRGVQQLPPRWKRCVRQVDHGLGEALGQEFVARTFSAETKQKTLPDDFADRAGDAERDRATGLDESGDQAGGPAEAACSP